MLARTLPLNSPMQTWKRAQLDIWLTIASVVEDAADEYLVPMALVSLMGCSWNRSAGMAPSEVLDIAACNGCLTPYLSSGILHAMAASCPPPLVVAIGFGSAVRLSSYRSLSGSSNTLYLCRVCTEHWFPPQTV